MDWQVEFDESFAEEFAQYATEVKKALAAEVRLLERFGPLLGRPHVDTLKGSRHVKMKELRFRAANGVWRAAFAFDPGRKAIVLVAGDKSGVGGRRFYQGLIATADERFDRHLQLIAKKVRP